MSRRACCPAFPRSGLDVSQPTRARCDCRLCEFRHSVFRRESRTLLCVSAILRRPSRLDRDRILRFQHNFRRHARGDLHRAVGALQRARHLACGRSTTQRCGQTHTRAARHGIGAWCVSPWPCLCSRMRLRHSALCASAAAGHAARADPAAGRNWPEDVAGIVLATLLIGAVNWGLFHGKFLFFASQVESVVRINTADYQIAGWFFKACRGAVFLLAVALPVLAIGATVRRTDDAAETRQIWLVNVVTLVIAAALFVDDALGGFFLQYDYYYVMLLPHIAISLTSLYARGSLSRPLARRACRRVRRDRSDVGVAERRDDQSVRCLARRWLLLGRRGAPCYRRFCRIDLRPTGTAEDGLAVAGFGARRLLGFFRAAAAHGAIGLGRRRSCAEALWCRQLHACAGCDAVSVVAPLLVTTGVLGLDRQRSRGDDRHSAVVRLLRRSDEAADARHVGRHFRAGLQGRQYHCSRSSRAPNLVELANVGLKAHGLAVEASDRTTVTYKGVSYSVVIGTLKALASNS